MLDIKLLQVLKQKKEYSNLVRTVPSASIDPKTKALLDDFGKYFKMFPDHDEIDLELFIPRFRQWHPSLTEEQFATYKSILNQIRETPDEGTKKGLLGDLYELGLGTTIANIVAKYEAGDLILPLADYVAAELDAYKMNVGLEAMAWESRSIEELLEEDLNNEGIRWRLNCINNCMRPLRPGDFGIVAGRPDKGKTSFLCSEVTFMADQLPEDRNVVWLCNEGMTGNIQKRLYQSALGKTIGEMVQMKRDGVDIAQEYANVVGRSDRIRVFQINGMHVGQVEAIIEANNPGIVVYDMIDNIRGFDGESRTDQKLEEMYKWARDRCIKYSSIGMAASQISIEGDNLMYPTLSMLKDSKTGKQGACDFQLMIGAHSDFPSTRFIGLPKNKLRREDAPGDPHAEVNFIHNIARFEDVPNG